MKPVSPVFLLRRAVPWCAVALACVVTPLHAEEPMGTADPVPPVTPVEVVAPQVAPPLATDPVMLPPVPLEGTVVAPASVDPDPRPKAVKRPWWGLGVSERTYRVVQPAGRVEGLLSDEESASFWSRYADLRRESLVLDAAQLGLLVAPLLLALVVTGAVPLLGLPMLQQVFNVTGAGAEGPMRAVFMLMPGAAFVAFVMAAACGAGFAALASLDAQDIGAPPLPVKATPAGARAVSRAERGTRVELLMGLCAAVGAVALGGAVLVTPWVLPLLLAPVLGASPFDAWQAWRVVAFQVGPIGVWSAIFAHVALAGVMTLIPLVMATGYAMRAVPGVMDGDDARGSLDEDAAGEDRDLTWYLNPRNFLFPKKKAAPTEPAPSTPP